MLKRFYAAGMVGLLLCMLSPLRADDAADQAANKAKMQAQVTQQTQIIAAGGDERSLIDAYYLRAYAYDALSEWDKATADIDETLNRVHKQPADRQPADLARVLVLKGQIEQDNGKWADALKDYEGAKQSDNFEGRINDVHIFYYNLSRVYAHNDYPSESRRSADRAITLTEGLTDAKSVNVRTLSLRQRAVARYGEGDLDGAKADWNAAKAGGMNLDDAPFDENQAPLNKAVQNGHEKERIARARFLRNKADLLMRRQTEAWEIGVDEKNLPKETGGTVSLADVAGVAGTPVSLLDDAINDLDMAIHRNVGDTWGLKNFDIALERGKALALRFQDSDDHRYSAQDVDDQVNRAVKLSPTNLDARRARADWLYFRLDHLNSLAIMADTNYENREKTRTALLHTANDDLARVLLADPKDVEQHLTRAKLTIQQPLEILSYKYVAGAPTEAKPTYTDGHAALVDLDAALNTHNDAGELLISDDNKRWAVKQRDQLRDAEAKLAKTDGTALEWKTKGNVAGAKKDYNAALEAYNTALAIDPTFADALNNRSNCYRELAQWDLALHDLDEAIRIQPKHRIAYFNRADLRMEIGDFDGSISDARRAVAVAPDEAGRHAADETLLRALFARADSRSEKKETLAGAFDDYHEGNTLAATIKLPPDAVHLQYEGAMAAQIGHAAEAMTALRAAHAAKPDDVWIEGWLTVVSTALDDAGAAALEQDIIARGTRSTLSNIDDIAISLHRISPNLTTQPAAAEKRLSDLHDRLFKAYQDKPGGTVIDGGGA